MSNKAKPESKGRRPNSKPPVTVVGRPQKLQPDDKTINILKGLGSIFCTTKEVAAVLGVNEVTLFAFWKDHPSIKAAFEDAKENGKASLRRHQLRLAEKNATMAIFLGLNYLEQRDRREFTGPGGGPIPIDLTDLRKLSDEQLDALAERMMQRPTKAPPS